MITILLITIIYSAFISLGLPDALLGAAWPVIHTEWGLTLDSAGLISFLITGGTVLSSFMSGYVIKKLGTGKVTFLSCLTTGLALLGFSYSQSYVWFILLAIPLGIGAGSVDAALNNYVALHFKSHHMNWLHSFWGIGATIGPIIMATALNSSLSWRGGYRIIALIQLSLSLILLLCLPLWKKHNTLTNNNTGKNIIIDSKVSIFKTKGLIYALTTFLFYCAVELSVGLWGSSFLVAKQISVDTAAKWVAIYYASITLGRFISGFISFKTSNRIMIRTGAIIALVGTIFLMLPLPTSLVIIPFILIGLGLSPIFPAMLHETPNRFGKQKSQTIIGYQMAFAYIGSSLFPPVFGIIINRIGMSLFPFLLFISTALVLLASERLTKLTKSIRT